MQSRTRYVPNLEALEDRLVPSSNNPFEHHHHHHHGDNPPPAVSTPTVDLSTAGAFGTVNGVVFDQPDPSTTEHNNFRAFLRIQGHDKSGIEQGINSNFAGVQFDEKRDRNHTRPLKLSDIPVVTVNGVAYRQLLLSVNQKGSQPSISLDELRLYLGQTDNLTNYDPDTHTFGDLSPVYDLDAGADSWVKLNANLNRGRGAGDAVLYIPDSVFGGATSGYVYLYSKFGVNFGANAGFEAWEVGKKAVQPPTDIFPTNPTSTAGSISGNVHDASLNGPMSGVTVYLDTNNNGSLDDGEVSMTTDPSGNYKFADLAFGTTYFVREIVPSGYMSQGNDVFVLPLDPLQPDLTSINFSNVLDGGSGGGGVANS